MNLLVPFGFYGAGNIGDEATLQGFARLVALQDRRVSAWVASGNPGHTGRVEPAFKYYTSCRRDVFRRRWARFRAVAHVFAGGTPIMDVLGDWYLNTVSSLISAANRQDKPVVFIGCGTETLQRSESQCIVQRELAPAVRRWSVRSERDRTRLVEYGVPPERILVAADMAWLLAPESADFGLQYLRECGAEQNVPWIGVNVNNEHFMCEQEPKLFEKLGAFLDGVVEESGAQILFLCNEVREDESFDRAASRKVIACMRRSDRAILIPNRYWTPQQMLSMIGCCRMTISTRYHFCLFSALQGVPFIALERSDKVSDLVWDLRWPCGMALSAVETSRLRNMFDEIEQRRPPLVQSLSEQVAVMRERSLSNRQVLDSLLPRGAQ